MNEGGKIKCNEPAIQSDQSPDATFPDMLIHGLLKEHSVVRANACLGQQLIVSP